MPRLAESGRVVECKEVPKQASTRSWRARRRSRGAVLCAILLSKVHSRDPVRGYGDTQLTDYHNAELDRLIELGGETLETRSRQRALEQSMELLMADPPLDLLCVGRLVTALREDLEWIPRADARWLAADFRRAERGAR